MSRKGVFCHDRFPLQKKSLYLEKEVNMEGNIRKDIQPGLKVAIILKEDQRSGALTEGVVRDILTNSPSHPHGIKVRLQSGQVGRVAKIL